MSLNAFILYLKKNENIQGVYFYFARSQYAFYKSFILNVLIQIISRGGVLVPELRHFIAHENKSFQ